MDAKTEGAEAMRDGGKDGSCLPGHAAPALHAEANRHGRIHPMHAEHSICCFVQCAGVLYDVNAA